MQNFLGVLNKEIPTSLECNSSNKHSSNVSLNIDFTTNNDSKTISIGESSDNLMVNKEFNMNKLNETENKNDNTYNTISM